ncbi:glycosyltransferase family 2 protein [Tibeticola sp.]|uniref:glycosyltransferase family 2 protein n=1 Tax=Tibeticola sp. TaxID=2005368 RepID=UPI0025D90832|nr:glycosyltransferase family 2 protein [Tibeticola sp.]
MLEKITPLILTCNEEVNIGRVLDKLRWAREIVVIDSCSTDRTKEICEKFDNVRFIVRPFDNHANQWNYGLKETGIATDWVLALDADYVLTDSFIAEVRSLSAEDSHSGYRIRFRYCVYGRPLLSSVYPPVVGLFLRRRAHYRQDGHTQRVVVDGPLGELHSEVLHDDRKPLIRWLVAQERYAQLERELLLNRPWRELRWQDRLRSLIFITPWLVPLYCLTVGKGFMDGWHGLYYALQRGVAEAVLSLKLLEAKLVAVNTKKENLK